MQNPLGFAGGATGVKDEERMLAVEALCRAVGRDILHFTVPPDIAPLLNVNLDFGAAENNDLFDGVIPLESMVDILFERDQLTAAIAAICSNHDLGSAIGKSVLDALCAESSKDDAVNGTDACTRQHGDGGLWNEGHVDEDTVSLLDPVTLEDIGKLADLAVELAVRQHLFISGLPLPNDGCLVGTGGLKVTVETVLSCIDFTSDKPLCVGELPIEHLGPFLRPVQFLCLACPELVRLVHRFGMELLVLGHASDAGFPGKRSRGLKDAILD